ncbi:T7SS effector LXG polymorphic toxin [uncultured Metabacillus sp.]|uniref:T7SS effector LXG polymorphic toxin n=1 Tax=uncultured Metabacillus sp. TaxID=2860135 RepID=UPI0026048597|nr:T7SS effector LXG polymorphic toxin [uncultured Metabacillus sp.]
MRVFEAKKLIEAMEVRAKQYQELLDNLEQVKKQCWNVVNLGEHFKGEGAEAVKGFYQAQIDVIEAWVLLINKRIAFFCGIEGTIEDLDLAGNTIIHVPFLENDLPNAVNLSEEIVLNQYFELTKILKKIEDLIDIDAFSNSRFEESQDRAEKQRRDTLAALDHLDRELMAEYKSINKDEEYVISLFRHLQQATSQGVQLSPIRFNAEAYKASNVFQLKKDTEQQAKDYLSYKEEQSNFRNQLKSKKET